MANDKRFNAKNGLSVGATPVNVIDANGSITANTLTVGGASINTTSYSGTANNATYLNGQLASYYTNASNITTGTLPYAQIPANVVNTTAAFTYSNTHTYNANVVIGSTGEIIINSAAGISANGTFGTAGQMLTTNGSAVYWSTPSPGDITTVTAGSGLTGGGTSGDVTVNVGAGTGITVNADDIAVNASYIATISANNAFYLGTYIASDYPRKAEAAAVTGAWNFSSGSIVWSGHSFTNTYDGSNVYQHIGTATSTDKIWNLRVYKADNNYTTFVFNSAGVATAENSYRAPIFYDIDNTGYYIDPFSVSNVYRVNSDGMSGNQFLAGTTNYADVVNGSTWYGIGRATSDLLGGGGNTVQVAGYYGLRMRTANATLDMYTSYTQASGSLRSPLFYDSNDTTYYLDPAGDSTLNNTYVNRYFQRNSGVPTNNLGTPTVTEMALFQEQFDNKTAFYPISNIKFYTSTDGNTWTEYTSFSDTEKRKFVGGNATSGINIPNNTPYFRIEILNNGAYVFLDALYMYWAGHVHSTTVKIRALRGDNTWIQWTNSNVQIGSWPGHMYMPFSSIPFIDVPGSTSHYKTVHIDFQPTWTTTGEYASLPIALYNMQIWGGYPASKRTIFSVDELKNTTFPGDVRATLFYDSDNSSYYINPNGSSVLSSLSLYSTNDVQLYLNGNGSSWAGINWTDVDNSDNIYYRGLTSTFSIGGSGTAVANKKLHVNGGTTIGSGLGATAVTTNGLLVEADIRSPLFYDSNDTSRYVDPNDVTIINDISARRIGISNTTGNNGYGISLYNGYTGGEPEYGLMFQQTGTFGTYGQVSGDWATYFNMNNNNARGWIFRKAGVGNIASISAGGEATFGTSVRTPIYYDSDNTAYYINPASGSLVYDFSVGQHLYLWRNFYSVNAAQSGWNTTLDWNSGSTIIYAGNSFRAPIFYDSDNTAYYLDAASTSVLGAVVLQNNNNLSWGNVYGSGIPTIAGATSTGLNFYPTGSTSGSTFEMRATHAYAAGSMRSPLFYDSDDTSYYVDPASSTAILTNGFIIAGQQGFQSRFYSAGRNRIWSFNNADAYGISYFQSSGGFDGSTDTIGFHFGTATAASSQFVFLASGYAQATNSWRAPIFYDSNDTRFYFDGAGTTNINALAGNGKNIFQTYDTYLRINEGSEFSSGTWFGGTLIQAGGVYSGSNGGTTNSRVAIIGGTYNGSNVITLDGSTGLITSRGTGLNGGLRLTNPTGARDFRVIQKDGGYFVVTDETAGAERLTINSSGLVQALGDLSTAGSLFVGGGAASYIYMNDSDNGQRVIHNNSDRIGFLTQAGAWGSWCEDSGQWTSEHSLRAPILYDHNDTGYYLDINGSNVSNINTIIAGLAYFRSNVGSGVYSGATSSPPLQAYSTDGGAAFMSFHRAGAYAVNMGLDPDNYLRIGGWSAGAGRWVLDMSGNNWAVGSFRAPIFYDSENTGYYMDASSTSRLSALLIGGSEALIYESATNAIGFRTGATGAFRYAGLGTDGRFTINNGGLTATGDVRGTIFYDSNDTNYYLDPAGATSLRTYGDWRADNSPWTGEFNGKIQYHASNWYFQGASNWEFRRSDSANAFFVNQAGECTARADFRAPIFYDSNNTGFYLDPNSTSVLNRIVGYLAGTYISTDWADAFRNTPTQSKTFHGDVSSGGPAGTWWFYESMRHSNGANFWGTQIAWGWEDNANRLLQRNVTANSFSGWVEYLNTSDRTYNGNLYMTGSIRSTSSDMRAPIFYDQDNTGYYLNPAATSYINALNVGPTAAGSSYVNINGYNAYGGTGFHGFMTIYNTYSSASNPYQYWRLNGAGGFEIVNSPYNAVLFTFTQGGDFTAAGNVTAYSDKRLKDNIAPINNALDKVLQLNGVTFTRIDKEDTTQRYAGLLAQDVEQVLPEAVQVNETMSYGEIMSVDYNATIALLVEAIKEQQLTIANQSAKINTLEAKLDQIIQKLEG